MRLLDRRFAGVARGVGTAQILGRVHSAQMKLADLHLACAFTIMEGRDVELLFGLDMLKAHQACIDLEKGVLRIRGREVRFLAEHELPEKAKLFEAPIDSPPQSSSGPSSSSAQPSQGGSSSQFPGPGHTIGGAPGNRPPRGVHAVPRPASVYPENAIQTLMNLGAQSREEAIHLLDRANGNLDVAASSLFG